MLSSSLTLLLTRSRAQVLGKCLWSFYSLPGTVLGVGAEPERAERGLERLTAKPEAQM